MKIIFLKKNYRWYLDQFDMGQTCIHMVIQGVFEMKISSFQYPPGWRSRSKEVFQLNSFNVQINNPRYINVYVNSQKK